MMIQKYILFGIIATLLLSACSEQELTPVLTIGAAPAITNPSAGNNFVLTEDISDNTFSTFAWSAASFGFNAGVDYSVELDLAGNNFAEPITLGIVNGLTLDNITNGAINSILLAKAAPDGVPTSVELRVVATVSKDVSPVISDVVSINVTPYKAFIVYPRLQVPGSYQGWDPTNESTVIYSVESNGKYEGYIYFREDGTQYKYTDGPSWDVNWGDNGADGILDLGGDNLMAASAGVYRLNVDINALTHKATKTDWGLIGSATSNGWDADQNMIFNEETGVLSITSDLIAGEIKFRANDAWDINLGDDNANGSLEYGGANIVIEEGGNYTIDLILNVAEYTYKVTKN